ncbi:HlyD family secretion protein [Devosia sp. YR412]|uniref:HlyD family type I secretion periplasmic adaptor subunit n=1 Tax=Devosia sp. YR412 TaxID=1881030 RepID=UPI0008C8BD18|nr:HlyD family type I secretion periplasmic adaptor subunit [Devosia sp. YR412]SEQ37552.1 HlyD family secretion protein [Devosia sp. YR412]
MATQIASLDWYEDVPRSIRRQTALGMLLVVVLVGGFSAWGFTAPLAAAVIASGSFVAIGENKIVQHLEGGIIESILVREGDQVGEGDILIKLNETEAKSNARQLFIRWLRLEAILERLQAESRGATEYGVPAVLAEQMSDPEVVAIVQSQQENFNAGRAKLSNETEVLEDNMLALGYQRDGQQAQLESMRSQETLLLADLTNRSSLLEKGLVTRSSINQLERAVADAQGDIAKLEADIQAADAQIARFVKEMIQLRDASQQASLDELQSVEAELDAVREQIRQADNVLDRTTVRAPVAGTIVRLFYHTAGGVIETGKPIIEILPADVPLIIEAQIPRMQIDEVHRDQPATVRLTALNQRTTPMLEGEVYYVSADSITDTTGASRDREVYLARISLSQAQLDRVHGFSPTPGMPAEVLIQTHERTFFEYLVKPIADSMARAFREY